MVTLTSCERTRLSGLELLFISPYSSIPRWQSFHQKSLFQVTEQLVLLQGDRSSTSSDEANITNRMVQKIPTQWREITFTKRRVRPPHWEERTEEKNKRIWVKQLKFEGKRREKKKRIRKKERNMKNKIFWDSDNHQQWPESFMGGWLGEVF